MINYSGVCWATADDFQRENKNLITDWPGTDRTEGKAPTELFYEDGQTFWGYDIPSDVLPIRWFKLLLLKDEDLSQELRQSEFLIRARKLLQQLHKTQIDVIADYLRLLWTHIQQNINQKLNQHVVRTLSFHVVVTVPAVWKGYARESMRQAVKQAGILSPRRGTGQTRLSFAPEPEAAALSALLERSGSVKKGDVYIVCDAGGGTTVGVLRTSRMSLANTSINRI